MEFREKGCNDGREDYKQSETTEIGNSYFKILGSSLCRVLISKFEYQNTLLLFNVSYQAY